MNEGIPLLRFFSLPIFVGVALGTVYPYPAFSLIWLSSFLLFTLLFVNTLSFEWRTVLPMVKGSLPQILSAQVLIFVFFPVVISAAGALLLRDRDYAFGIAVSALAPCALINPFFAERRGGSRDVALINIAISALLSPLLTGLILDLLGFGGIFTAPGAYFRFLALLTVVPILFSWPVGRVLPRVRDILVSQTPLLNSLLLAALIFILTGVSLNRAPLRLLLDSELALVFGFYFLMDFGIYLLVRKTASAFFSSKAAETLALSAGSRNFAVTAALLLTFYPKAALAPAVGLLVHGLFFQWLLLTAPAAQANVSAAR